MKSNYLPTKISELRSPVSESQKKEMPPIILDDSSDVLEELSEALDQLKGMKEEINRQKGRLGSVCFTMGREHNLCQEMLGHVPDGRLVTDLRGIIKDADAAASAILGTGIGGLTGRHMSSFISKSEREDFCSWLSCLESSEEMHWEVQIEPERGDALTVVISASPIRDADIEPEGLLLLLRDASERKRDGILTGIAIASHSLITIESPDLAIKEALKMLGTATDVDRIYIFEGLGAHLFSQRFEWLRENISPHSVRFSSIDLSSDTAFSRWHSVLSKGVPVKGLVEDFPEDERRVLEAEGIVSIIVMPVIANGNLWGFMGFDDCTARRIWTERERMVLLAAAGSIGGAIFRKRAEEELSQILDDFETRVSDRTEELARANNALKREIAERRKAEESLLKSEARYRAVVEDQTELICRYLPDGTITFVNEAYCKYFGKSREELVGRSFMPLIPVKDRETAKAEISHLEIDHPIASCQRRVIAPEGIRWQHWTDRAIFDDLGRLVEIQSVGRDITEQKLMEEAIRESEERDRYLVESMNEGFGIRDENGIVTYANDKLCGMLGYSKEEIVGRALTDLMDEESRTILEDQMAKRRSRDITPRDSAPYELKWQRKDGRELPTIISPRPIFDESGCFKGCFAVITDITERKMAEESLLKARDDLEAKVEERTSELAKINRELTASEARYRAIVEDQTEFISRFTPDFKRTFVNEAYCKCMGISREELIGSSIMDQVFEEDKDDLMKRISSLSAKNPSTSGENRSMTKQGARWQHWTNRAIFDENGNLSEIQSVGRDITERKLAEEALMKSEERFRTSIDTLLDSFGICSAVRDESGAIVDFRIEYLNNAVSKFTSHIREDPTGKSLLRMMPSLRDRRVFDDYCSVVEKSIPLEREILYFEDTPGQKRLRRAFEIRAVKLGDGIATTWRDVTGRKQAERELDELRLQMEFILGATKTGLDIVDSEFNLRYIDPEWKRSYGDPSGKKCYQYFERSEDVCPGCPVVKTLHTKKGEVVERCLMKEGKRPVQVTTIPYQDEQGDWLVAQVHVDITERKAAEEELRKRECILMGVAVATNALLTAGDFDTAINQSLELLGCTADVDRVYIYENHDSGEKHLMSMRYEWSREGIRSLIEDPIWQNAPYDEFPKWYSRLSSNKPINGLVRDFAPQIRSRIEQCGTISLLMIPIMIDDKFWGLIGFDECHVERLWTWSEVSILLAAAGSIGGAVARRLAEVKLLASLDEKEVLIKEVHHRVKNNLQVISSLLSLQSNSIEDDRALEMLKESQNRVKSMALIHEKLYRSEDLARIDFAEYMRNLIHFLYRSYETGDRQISLNLNLKKAFLGIDTAIPCGLIINELVSNCLKHAFKGLNKGEIKISLQSNDERLILTISDNGIGIPDDFEISKAKSLGMRLVVNLVKQLKGRIDIRVNGGTEFNITLAERNSI